MCLKIIQKCLPKAFDPESFLQNPLLGKVLIETVEKAQSLYTCFFLRSVRWFGDSDKCCYKCSATTYPSHTPYSHDESLSRYPKSSRATWEAQTITVTLPVTPLATADGIADQRRHWWHIEEVNSV